MTINYDKLGTDEAYIPDRWILGKITFEGYFRMVVMEEFYKQKQRRAVAAHQMHSC